MPQRSIPQDAQNSSNADASPQQQRDYSYEVVLTRTVSTPYIMVPSRAHVDRRVTPAMLRVFISMCWHANQQYECWASQETIANEIGVTKQAVCKSMQQLSALGYLQLVARGFRGSGQTNRYRVIWQPATPTTDTPPDTTVTPPSPHRKNRHSQPHVDSIVNPTLTHSQPHVDQNNTNEQYQGTTYPKRSFNSTSLAQSAKNAPTTPTTAQAPADRGTRESVFNTSALKRDPLFLALVACLGREPLTTREWKQWLQAVRELRTAQVTAAQIPQAIRGFQAQFPRATVTPLGLCNHWSLIWKGKAHDVAQLEIHQRTAAAAAAHPADDAARRERERAEVDQLMSEWGYGARAGDIPRG